LATLRELRQRIASVQNTQKITKAKELVAAAKMRRAQAAMEASRPYSEGIARMLGRLAARKLDASHPFLEARDVNNRLLIVVTADRGLTGGLNINAIRAANRFIQSEPTPVKLVTIGRKGRDYFKRVQVDIIADRSQIGDRPPIAEILPAVTVAMDEYIEGNVEEVWLLFTRYINPVSQVPTVVKIIPPVIPEHQEKAGGGAESLYEFEPSAEEVLDALLPKYVTERLFNALLQSAASELAARQRAMKSATDNAEELIRKYTRLANQSRQAEITQEISEIVGGVEALASAK
jgi:F-type H+-transporting ATPase subunit gamma